MSRQNPWLKFSGATTVANEAITEAIERYLHEVMFEKENRQAGNYPDDGREWRRVSREEVIADAIRNLLLNNRSLRLEVALDLFKTGEVSLGRGAEIAGLDRGQFQDILHERHIPILIEAGSAEAMDNELAVFYNGQK